MSRIYDRQDWKHARSRTLERQPDCLLAAFGDCHGPLHVHHLDRQSDPYEGPLATVCARHHPIVEAMQRRSRQYRRCPHRHRYPGAREQCERRLNQAA